MATTPPTTSGPTSVYDKPGSVWADGLAVFGGCALITLGLFQFLQGLSAALEDKVFVATQNYVFDFDLTTWGWIHMIVGVLAVVVGVGIIAGQAWGFVLGVVVAIISALTSFAFMPYYPLWSLVVIAFDIAVIWALSSMITRSRTA